MIQNPSVSPIGGRKVGTGGGIRLSEDTCDIRRHPVCKVTAAKGHHDGNADTLLCGILQTAGARLIILIEVVILNLAEIPVI